MDYSQFLNMFPEATLMAILVVVFLTDFGQFHVREGVIRSRNDTKLFESP